MDTYMLSHVIIQNNATMKRDSTRIAILISSIDNDIRFYGKKFGVTTNKRLHSV